ncbi:MAG: low molecular weight phosphotyrosine protein phosphatase [Muribaculaceae bacterium]|nr:low molecular weight phosphotyrosine protein phosphatase [Muribaculaceae bacterium]
MNYSEKYRQLLSALKEKDKVRVLFVCLGNICRSPAADGIFQAKVEEAGLADRFDIDSAGTGGYHIGDLPDNRMRIHARRRGYELTHRARKFSPADFDDFDLIVPMDGSNEQNLRRQARTLEDERKIVPMASFVDKAMRFDYIPDPYYEGAEGFETVLDLLENGTDNLLNALS